MMTAKENTKRVFVVTENRFLFQKIRLELSGVAECVISDGEGCARGAFCLIDTDTKGDCSALGIRMSYTDERAELRLPFKIGDLRRLISGESANQISVDEDKRCVRFGGRVISLTDVEFALFLAIYRRGGEFVSRDAILREVWGGECDGGIINVYVHYLREKLECDGEKIILCSRKCGYAISKKYIGGGDNA